MYLQTLKEKSGSTTTLRMFRYQVRELLKSPEEDICDLLDYVMRFDADKDMVVFARNSEFLNNRALDLEPNGTKTYAH
jgi:hypothetical protein